MGRMIQSKAEIVREYGPFPGIERVNGVTYDGVNVWFASDDRLNALDPVKGEPVRSINIDSHAGSAFDGTYLYQISGSRITKIDPESGTVVSSIPTPETDGRESGLAWAEGSLWVGHYDKGLIHQINPETGTVLRTIESNRFVTGVTWVDSELWHGTWQDDESDIRRVDPLTGEVLELIEMPTGFGVSGLESDGAGQFYCGGGGTGIVRAVRRPKRGAAAPSA